MGIGIESVFWRITPFYRERGAAFDCRPGDIRKDSDPTRQFDDRPELANSPRLVFLQFVSLSRLRTAAVRATHTAFPES